MDIMNSVKTLTDKSRFFRRLGPVWSVVIFCGIIVVVVLLISFIPGVDKKNPVKFAVVKKGDITIDLIETGDIEAVSQHAIAAPMMWGSKLQVIELVEEGTIVKKGDFLLRFDVSDMQSRYDLAKDRLGSLEADLNKLDAQHKLTIQNMENQLKLTRYSFEQAGLRLEMKKFESDARRKEARLQLKQAELDLERVNKQLVSQKIINYSQRLKMVLSVKQAKYKLESLEARMAKFVLTAPEDGMIVYADQRNERLKKGLEARPGRMLMSIPDLSHMQIKIFINETDRQNIALGQQVLIGLEAYPEARFTGTIREVSMMAQDMDFSSGLKSFVAIADIDLPEIDPRLKPGMTAIVHIIENVLHDVLYVPIGVVFEKDGKSVVCPLKGGREIVVEILARNDRQAAIRGKIKEGQKIVWKPKSEDIDILGQLEESRRVDVLRERILSSFSVFKDRGILFDYIGSSESGDSKNADFDISKLPSSLRERITKGKTESGNKPTIKVGEVSGKLKKDSFKVSPEMMKRLKKNNN